jgi:hypothetical protein
MCLSNSATQGPLVGPVELMMLSTTIISAALGLPERLDEQDALGKVGALGVELVERGGERARGQAAVGHAGEARGEQPQRTGAVRDGDNGVAEGDSEWWKKCNAAVVPATLHVFGFGEG